MASKTKSKVSYQRGKPAQWDPDSLGHLTLERLVRQLEPGPNTAVGHFLETNAFSSGRRDIEDAVEKQGGNRAPPSVKDSPESTGLVLLNLSSAPRTLGSPVLNYRKSQTGYQEACIFKQPSLSLKCRWWDVLISGRRFCRKARNLFCKLEHENLGTHQGKMQVRHNTSKGS